MSGVRMKAAEARSLRKRVVQTYQSANFACNRTKTIQHFVKEGHSYATIHQMLQQFITCGKSSPLKKSGRPLKTTKKFVNSVKNKFKKDANLSNRYLAKKLKVDESTIRVAKKKANIKTRKCQKAPLYKNDQESRAKTNCRKLSDKKFVRKFVIMDDETYVLATRTSTPGNKYYSCIDGQDVSPSKKFKQTEKFPKKFLIWQAIGDDGKVSPSKVLSGTMNTDTYFECIEKVLIPWIKEEYGAQNVVFWPDMASCHYAKKVIAILRAENIDFVERAENAPNLPQGRPIERFWALCKKEMSVDIRDINHMDKEWKKVSKKVAEMHGQRIMQGLRSKIRKVGRKGVYSIL